MENKIILVSGYCATGKSTFSHKLARELSIPCFNKDVIKEKLGDGFGSESGEVFAKGSYVTFSLMMHITECLLQAGKPFILESNFRLSEIEKINVLLQKYNGESLLFRFIGDLDVLFDRYAARYNAGERHWVHKSAGDREGFKNAMSGRFGLEDAAVDHMVTADATSFDNVNYENLYDIAKRFIK